MTGASALHQAMASFICQERRVNCCAFHQHGRPLAPCLVIEPQRNVKRMSAKPHLALSLEVELRVKDWD